jgi:sugar phosphate isomerase/epimerase
MRFAFSTISCPKWDFPTIARRAREMGYDGVEIRGFLNEPSMTEASLFDADLAQLRSTFASSGIAVACLSSSIAMTGKRRRDRQGVADLHRYVDVARKLGCERVKIFDTQVKPGWSRAEAGIVLGDWLAPLADYAGDQGVVLLVENALSFRNAKELWTILDRLNHPSIAVCWDIFNAATVGESPFVSVPTLNSRIQFTQVKDATLGQLGATYCKLGNGDIPVQKFVERLRGIGYDGWISVEWEKAFLPGLAEPDDVLPDALAKLKQWSTGAPDPEADGDAKPTPQRATAAAH